MRPREFDAHPVSFAEALRRGYWRAIGKGNHDGDTLIVFADKGMFDYQMYTLRLLGINTPEVVGTSGVVLERALKATERVRTLTLDRPLLFRTQLGRTGIERMTFDRYLADVVYFGLSGTELDLASQLIAEGLGDVIQRSM